MTSSNHYINIQLAKFISSCFDLRNTGLNSEQLFLSLFLLLNERLRDDNFERREIQSPKPTELPQPPKNTSFLHSATILTLIISNVTKITRIIFFAVVIWKTIRFISAKNNFGG